MKSSKVFLALIASITLHHAAAVSAAGIDMDDPRRSLGREGDVRIDAQLIRETVTSGTPVAITYQIQNFSASPIAIAHRVSDASYDDESRTITLVVGSEVPPDGNMPHLVVIAPGEKRVLHAAATPLMSRVALRASHGALPRYVQVKVAILRDFHLFLPLIHTQDARVKQQLTDEQFEKWLESNDTIFLNAVPVRYVPPSPDAGAERRESRASF